MPVNCSETRFHSSWMAVELPMKMEAIFKPLGGMSQTDDLMLLGIHSSAFSTSWCTDNVALYGSTTVSDTFGDGTTEKVNMTRSGYFTNLGDQKCAHTSTRAA